MFQVSTRAALCIVAVGIAGAIGAQGCATNQLDVGPSPTADAGPGFSPSPPEGGTSTLAARCIATECQPGYATCPDPDGLGDTHTCTVDLANDDDNCGRCGNACSQGDPTYPLFGNARCVNGACTLVCGKGFGDCNAIPEDGCETPLDTADDCSACGLECAPGVLCIQGKCGCAAGLTACGPPDDIRCVDLLSSDFNCGACGTVCDGDKVVGGFLVGLDGKRLPPNTHTGCGNGQCKSPKCDVGAGFTFADCDVSLPADLALADPSKGNGCEIDLLGDLDNNHCRTCDVKCAAGVNCVDDFQLGRVCGCPPGATQCAPDSPYGSECHNLGSDANNCGSCGNVCPDAGPHATRTCDRGACSNECDPGWADCNGQFIAGCEVNLDTDPTSCGACGASCDLVLGQPCTNGVCSTRDCPPGVTK